MFLLRAILQITIFLAHLHASFVEKALLIRPTSFSFARLSVMCRNVLLGISDSEILSLDEVAMICWGAWRDRCNYKYGTGYQKAFIISTDWMLNYWHEYIAVHESL